VEASFPVRPSAAKYDRCCMGLLSRSKRRSRNAAYCRCGHARAAHQHYRRGFDCSLCGASVCPRYRRRWWPWFLSGGQAGRSRPPA